MRLLSAAIIAIALSVAACGGDDNGPTSSPTPTASTSATPTRSPTATPIASPYPTLPLTPAPSATPFPTPVPAPPLNVNSDTRVVFIRNPTESYSSHGDLWMADLASHTQHLTPDGVTSSFVGITADPFAGPATVYYITAASDDEATLYARALPDGEPQLVAHIRPWYAERSNGSLSPDGRYIAYTDRYGIELLDLQTSEFRLIAAGGNKDDCANNVAISSCKGFITIKWSPDGKLIAANEYFWEGGASFIVDPFNVGTPVQAGNCCGAAWSTDGSAICSYGEYGGYSALYISRPPKWQKQTYFPEYVTQTENPFRSIIGCDWIDANTVAVAILVDPGYPEPAYTYAASVNFTTSEVTNLSNGTAHEQCCQRNVFTTPADGYVFTQYWQKAPVDPKGAYPTQPEAIDVANSQHYTFLQPGDVITDVVTR